MSGRTLVLFLVALLIAVVTVVIVKNRAAPSTASSGIKILAASSDIQAGSFVRADKQLTWIDWPQGDVSPSFITSEGHKIEDYNGGVARRTIMSGEPVTTVSVVRATEGGFMSAVLAPGKRAVSIAVSPTSGNAGFIFPGDRVDLILTHRIPGKSAGGDELASETFIEDVRVLAIDQMLDNPDNKAVVAKTITMEVMPKQAEMINVATSLGAISVSLRSLASAARPVEKDAGTESKNKAPVTEVIAVPGQPILSPDLPNHNYSTNNDVSKLMGDKSDIHARVSVYHGTSSEQLDFRQGAQ